MAGISRIMYYLRTPGKMLDDVGRVADRNGISDDQDPGRFGAGSGQEKGKRDES